MRSPTHPSTDSPSNFAPGLPGRPAINAGILGVGMAVPDTILTNDDIAKRVETNNEWIVSRTGIEERRVCGPNDNSSSLGLLAARRALEHAGVAPEEIDLIICGTATGDYPWPATACLIQEQLGAKKAAAFDLSAACSGFSYGLATGAGFIQNGSMKRVLVIGVDTLSKQVDWEDRSTCILFGDGAGAALLGPCAPDEGILASSLGADGSGFEQIWLEGGSNRIPVSIEIINEKRNCIRMKGAEVFKFAVKIMGEASLEALCRAGLSPEDVSLFIPHQANIRIIHAAAERMGLPPEKVFVNVHKYGNTSAGSIPIALVEAVEQGRVKRGDVLVFVGFGAGLTWGANVLRWNRD
jgi:3-oxoacyl-[acyl-carrier-protein] synthase III